MRRLVLPRCHMAWFRDEAAARLVEHQTAMSPVPVDDLAYPGLRRLQDFLIAELEVWKKLATDDTRHAYLIGEEELERDEAGRLQRIGPLTFSRAPEPRFGLLVRGPFCWLDTGGGRCAAPATPDQPAEGLYVPVTRKVSLKNETTGTQDRPL